MTKITIKNASLFNIIKINQLMLLSKAYWQYESNFLNNFIKKFRVTPAYLKKNTVKLFYINKKLIGFYSFCTNDDNLLMLDHFFLHPDHIGKGWGEKLWESCCKTVVELNKSEFILCSDPHAEAFYLKMGCEKIGVQQSKLCPTRYLPILKYQIA